MPDKGNSTPTGEVIRLILELGATLWLESNPGTDKMALRRLFSYEADLAFSGVTGWF